MEVKLHDSDWSHIIRSYGLNPDDFLIERVGSGHIHQTFRLSGKTNYILQRINKEVFKQPEVIASNLRLAFDFLKKNYPVYLFPGALLSSENQEMVYDAEEFPWRLFPYRENTITIDRLSNPKEAMSAAREFARLTRYLDKIDILGFKETIPQFHDLHLRYRQFEEALQKADPERKNKSADSIMTCQSHYPLVKEYDTLLKNGVLRLRITHNDTKINNILFDRDSREAVCVIDLDTLMPGYFIYDLGDMVRTFVSPADEEEADYSKIIFRREVYDALLAGYRSQMDEVMSEQEKAVIPFAGKMMTYIMALRFLTDYLNGDIYYHTTYPGQNLVRTGNQLRLLEIIINLKN